MGGYIEVMVANRLRRLWWAGLGGLLFGLSFPPAGLIFTFLPGFMLLFWTIEESETEWEALRLGFVFGLLFYLVHAYWFFAFAPAVLPLILIWLGAYTGLWALVVKKFNGSIIVALVAWIFLEWLLEVGLFGQNYVAFPWSRISTALAARPLLVQPLRWLGEYLWGGVWLAMSLSWAVWLKNRRALSRALLLSVLTVLLLTAGYIGLESAGTDAESRKIMIVQPDVSSVGPHPNPGQLQQERLGELTAQHADPDELVVWPETVLVYPSFRVEEGEARWPSYHFRQFIGEAVGGERELFFGATFYDPQPRALDRLNGALLVDRNLEIAGYYTKRIPVPGGEHLPLMGRWEAWGNLARKMGTHGYRPGSKGGLIPLDADGSRKKIGVQICYESAFSAFVRRQVEEGADLLITIANDSWSKSWASHHQHGLQARMRAIETGRPLLRAGNTGMSAIIDGRGRFREYLPPYEKGVLRGKLPAADPLPIYGRWGDWLTFLGAAGLLMLKFLNK